VLTTNSGHVPPAGGDSPSVQATAMGRVIAAHMDPSALHKALNSHSALRAMKSQHAWFVPMLEILVTVNAAQGRRSTRLRSLFHTNVAPEEPDTIVVPSPDGFDSVVRHTHTHTHTPTHTHTHTHTHTPTQTLISH
jgi:hypothetical protein